MSLTIPESLLVHFPVWEWCDGTGVYISYTDGNRIKLETVFQQGGSPLQIANDNVRVLVDVHEMTQRVVRPPTAGAPSGTLGPVRTVRRTEKHMISDPTWIAQNEDAVVVPVPAGHTDADLAIKLVLGSAQQNLAIVMVERVQHRGLKWRYELERKEMIRERGTDQLNERTLFHGTGKHLPEAIALNRDGFMSERSRENCLYSKGCYFAEKCCYSLEYAHRRYDVNKIQQVMLVDVLCGRALEMERKIDREGKICNRAWLRDHGFDSVRGGPHIPGTGMESSQSSMIVVYRPNQAYPRFIVSVAPIGISGMIAYTSIPQHSEDDEITIAPEEVSAHVQKDMDQHSGSSSSADYGHMWNHLQKCLQKKDAQIEELARDNRLYKQLYSMKERELKAEAEKRAIRTETAEDAGLKADHGRELARKKLVDAETALAAATARTKTACREAEDARLKAEHGRKEREKKLLDAETALAAETERTKIACKEAADARLNAEHGREVAEKKLPDAATALAASIARAQTACREAEDARLKAEHGRDEAEMKLLLAETARLNAEHGREVAKQLLDLEAALVGARLKSKVKKLLDAETALAAETAGTKTACKEAAEDARLNAEREVAEKKLLAAETALAAERIAFKEAEGAMLEQYVGRCLSVFSFGLLLLMCVYLFSRSPAHRFFHAHGPVSEGDFPGVPFQVPDAGLTFWY